MDTPAKQIIAIFGAVIVFSFGIYGNYLPWAKSVAYVVASQNAGNAKSLDELKKIIEPALDMGSPVGQPELVRNMANSLMYTIRNSQDHNLIDATMQFLDKYMGPTVERGRGMSYGQDMYIWGIMNETAAVQSRNSAYADIAQDTFSKCVSLAPDRPQCLYGLMDIYRIKGEKEKLKGVAEKVLQNWPNDERTAGILAGLNGSAPTSTIKK